MTSPTVLQENNMDSDTNEGVSAFDDERLSKGILLLDASVAAVSQAALRNNKSKTTPEVDNERKNPSPRGRQQQQQQEDVVVKQQESFLHSFVDQLLSNSPSSAEHENETDIVLEPTYYHPPQADIQFSPTNSLLSLSPLRRHASNMNNNNDNDDERDIIVLPTEVSPTQSPLKPKKLSLSSSLSFKSSSSHGSISTMTKQQEQDYNKKKQWIALPNTINSKVSVTDLIRRLSQTGNLSQQDHQYYNKNNKTYLYVKGEQVLHVVQRLYFFSSQDQLETFGEELIQKQVLYAWTASHVPFRDALVVLFPFRDPAVLNNFCQWSHRVDATATTTTTATANNSNKSPHRCHLHQESQKNTDNDTEDATVEDPMDVILRLSRQMDRLCNSIFESNNANRRDVTTTTTSTVTQDDFYQYQIDCCQLQMTHFPTNSAVERVAFALNLFNLIVRHAMLLYRGSDGGGGDGSGSGLYQWQWPRNLRQLKLFLARIGYNVGGEWYSLADLQSSLYGYHCSGSGGGGSDNRGRGRANQQQRHHNNEPKLVTKPVLGDGMPWQRFWCRICNNTGAHETYYQRPAIQNDPRILFAMTWACVSSPTAVTAYPNRLHECLQTAAEQYCQQHVEIIVHNGGARPPTVILPTLLAWHRKDFGNSVKPLTVLYEILPFLSTRQLRLMEGARQKTGRLQVEFASERDFDWTCGMTPEGVAAEPSSLLLQSSSNNNHPHRQPSRMSVSVSDLYTTTTTTGQTSQHQKSHHRQQRRPPAHGTPATAGLSSSMSGDIHYSPYHPPSICRDIQVRSPSSPKQQLQQGASGAYDDDDDEEPYFDDDGTDYELEDMYGDDDDNLFRSDMSAITMESTEFDDPSLRALLDRLDL